MMKVVIHRQEQRDPDSIPKHRESVRIGISDYATDYRHAHEDPNEVSQHAHSYCFHWFEFWIALKMNRIDVDLTLVSCEEAGVDISSADVQEYVGLAKEAGYKVKIIT